MGGPLAGLASFQILQARAHSAASRAGTIPEGRIRSHKPFSPMPPSGMVDPHHNKTVPISPAEPDGSRILRNIRRPRHAHDASTDASSIHNNNADMCGRTRRPAPTQTFRVEHHPIKAIGMSSLIQRVERSGVSGKGRNHLRPETTINCGCKHPMDVLAKAGVGYTAQPTCWFLMHYTD